MNQISVPRKRRSLPRAAHDKPIAPVQQCNAHKGYPDDDVADIVSVGNLQLSIDQDSGRGNLKGTDTECSRLGSC